MASEKQILYDSLGKKLVVTPEEKKPVVIKSFKRENGIRKKRRKRISAKKFIEMNPELSFGAEYARH